MIPDHITQLVSFDVTLSVTIPPEETVYPDQENIVAAQTELVQKLRELHKFGIYFEEILDSSIFVRRNNNWVKKG